MKGFIAVSGTCGNDRCRFFVIHRDRFNSLLKSLWLAKYSAAL